MRSHHHSDKLIWLIEDNRMDRDLALRAFAHHNISHRIEVFRDGSQALIAINTWKVGDPVPGLVLLDLKLPKVNGFQVLRHLKQHPHLYMTPVVVLSSSGQRDDIQKAYRLGANSYLVKPIDYDAFLEMIGEVSRYWFGHNREPDADSGEP